MLEKKAGKAGDELIVRGQEVAPHIAQAAAEFTRNVLQQRFNARDEKLTPAAAAEEISRYKSTSRKHLQEAVQLAYGVYAAAQHDQLFAEITAKIVSRASSSHDAKKSQLRLILEAVVEYGDSTPAGRATARRLYSRDDRAITYLISAGVEPGRMWGPDRKKREGLDHWARQAAKLGKPETKAKVEIKDDEDTCLRTGARVLVPEANPGEWWEAKVISVDGAEVVLRWANKTQSSDNVPFIRPASDLMKFPSGMKRNRGQLNPK
jgi:hypothetical protein